MSEIQFPLSTSALRSFLPHRPPMVWIDEVLSCKSGETGIIAVCRCSLLGERSFKNANGTVRPSTIVEWIAQGYGFAKACHHLSTGHSNEGFGRAYLVGITECEIDMAEIMAESAVLIEVEEVREFPPAYIVDGKVTSENGLRIFGSARIKVFGDVVVLSPAVS